VSFDPGAFNPHDAAFLANPYPTYADFRRVAPVAQVAPYGSYWVFRYDDVKTVLECKDVFLKNRPGPPASGPVVSALGALPAGVFSMDPPRHSVVRPILDDLFAQAIASAPALITARAARLLSAVTGAGRIELVSDFAAPLPEGVLFDVLGIPSADQPLAAAWVRGALAGHDLTAPAAARQGAVGASFALSAYMRALMGLCPAHPDYNGMLPLMARACTASGMSANDAEASAVNLAVAGFLSTTFLIGTGTWNLLRTPGSWQALIDDPALIAPAIDEMLRFDAPAQLVDRFTAADVELAGVTLPEGTAVTAVLGSANHDDDAFPDPERFDVTRRPSGHVAFGDGIHACLGAPLVRLVAPIAFQSLLERFAAPRLAGLAQWQTDPYLRALTSLPLAID
jgi:cytochrome P450